jgi:hypothetical protein
MTGCVLPRCDHVECRLLCPAGDDSSHDGIGSTQTQAASHDMPPVRS